MPFPNLTERCKEKLASICTSEHMCPHLPMSPTIVINNFFKVSKSEKRKTKEKKWKDGFLSGVETQRC